MSNDDDAERIENNRSAPRALTDPRLEVPLPLLLTAAELARSLRIDAGRACAGLGEGMLPKARRFGRTVPVSRHALVRWFAEAGATSDGLAPSHYEAVARGESADQTGGRQ